METHIEELKIELSRKDTYIKQKDEIILDNTNKNI